MSPFLLFVKKHKFVFIFLAVVLLLYFQDDIRSLISLTKERFELPHYKAAVIIDADAFQKIESQFSVISYEAFGNNIVYDKVEDTYYSVGSYATYEIDTPISKYIHSTTSEASLFILPADERFVTDGGFACFSCGCECYVDRMFLSASGKKFLIVTGKDFALSHERQGLYYLNDTTNEWLKLTPGLEMRGTDMNGLGHDIYTDDKLKLFNSGCSVAYAYKNKYYKLDVCNKP